MKQFLAISAIGKDRPGLAHDVVRTISDCAASINESRMLPLGGEFAMQLLVSGNWHAVARVESELMRLAESAGLALHLRRTEQRATPST
jgi:glycine cleavage system transcriptional repressor